MINFKWEAPQSVKTVNGVKWVRRWKVEKDMSEGFWLFWNKNKEDLKRKGYSIHKDSFDWYFCQWFDKQPEYTPPQEEIKEYVPEILPDIELKNKDGLRDWQIPHAQKLVASIKKWGSAIDGSDAGTGKTYIGGAVARELNMKIGVICPKAVLESWRRVITNHFKMQDRIEFIVNYESLKTGKYEKIAVWKKKKGAVHKKEFIWTVKDNVLLIFDECHKCKGRNTKNAQMLIAARQQNKKLLLCSATSAIDPTELKAIGYAVGLHKNTKFNAWLEENGCKMGRFGYEFNQSQDILTRLNKQLFLERGNRLKRDTIPNFPECETIVDVYDMEDNITNDINTVYREMITEIKDLENRTGMNNKEKSVCKLTAILRARQKTELLKVPLFVEMVEDALHDGFSVVLMVNFSDTILALSERLNTKLIIWGENKPHERTKFIDSFQNDEHRIILVNIASGGVGLSLHDLNGKCPRMAIISPNYSAVMLKQALGRVWRDGAKTKALQKIVYVANTVEEEMCEKLKLKLDNMDIINDGDLNPDAIKF